MIRGARAELAKAMQSGQMVRVGRGLEPGHSDGYVAGLSQRWALLLVVGGGVSYWGFQAFRIEDIDLLALPAPHAAFMEAALRKRRTRRPAVPDIDLTNTHALVASAARAFPLVTVYKEMDDPNICHIGRVLSMSRSALTMREITADALWETLPQEHLYKAITRVDFGGPYEEALALVAAPLG